MGGRQGAGCESRIWVVADELGRLAQLHAVLLAVPGDT
jgi:hypothetical protein